MSSNEFSHIENEKQVSGSIEENTLDHGYNLIVSSGILKIAGVALFFLACFILMAFLLNKST